MHRDSVIFVAGHRGMAGSAIVRRLESLGHARIVKRTHAELDLLDQRSVNAFFEETKPEYVFLAAARVGGILANNTFPADFIYQNLTIQNHVIHAAWQHGVRRLLFLGSSCIYPKFCPQPMKEEYLMTGVLEPTNAPYATAKIAGIEMCWSYNRQHGTFFIPVMPTNLYGPNDNFDLESSHVLPALIRKFHEAVVNRQPSVTLWGTGAPKREFLHVDDMADACVHLMNLPDDRLRNACSSLLFNIGLGEDLSILELAEMIAGITGFKGRLAFDPSKPDGTPRKLLDVSRMEALGWKARIGLRQGIEAVYQWFRENGDRANPIAAENKKGDKAVR